MPAPERFSIVAPLDPLGGWRRALALDRGPGTPRAVVLAFVPDEITGDAARLGAVLRDVEAAGRFHHPGAVSVAGTETVGGALAVVEPYRPGTSLRAVIDAGGKLPPDLAARVVVDASAAIAKAHALDGGDGKPLVHGAIDCARIAVGEDGCAFLSGFAQGGGGDPAADVRALGAVLHELVHGEKAGASARPAEGVAIPEALSRAAARALGGEGGPFSSATAFAEAVAAAGPVASRDAVAAYVEAILPRAEAHPPALRPALETAPPVESDAEEVAAENLIVDPTDPAVVRTPPKPFAAPFAGPFPAALAAPVEASLEPPLAPARPARDAATTFRAPSHARRRSRLPLAVASVCALVGFGGGFTAARLAPEFAAPAPAAEAVAEPAAPAAATPASLAPARPERRPAPTAKAAKAGKNAKPARRGARAAKAEKPERASAEEPAAVPGTGTLDVTAPPDAEVFLDGHRIAVGSIRMQIAEGSHQIEVRRGAARVAERFSVGPGETWTYAVTPQPQ